jgi:hypothetical protein
MKMELCSGFRDSADNLERRLNQGCIVFLAFLSGPDSTKKVVGYDVSQFGVFSVFGRVYEVSPDICFSHYTEVSPEYRGRRIKAILDARKVEHCLTIGSRLVCGVNLPANAPSIRANLRSGFTIAATVREISLLRSWRRWDTSLRVSSELFAGPVAFKQFEAQVKAKQGGVQVKA